MHFERRQGGYGERFDIRVFPIRGFCLEFFYVRFMVIDHSFDVGLSKESPDIKWLAHHGAIKSPAS